MCSLAKFGSFDIRSGASSLASLSQVNNRIVVMSIHQPRYSIVKLFDTLTLINRGELVFQGHTERAIAYFGELGESRFHTHSM